MFATRKRRQSDRELRMVRIELESARQRLKQAAEEHTSNVDDLLKKRDSAPDDVELDSLEISLD